MQPEDLAGLSTLKTEGILTLFKINNGGCRAFDIDVQFKIIGIQQSVLVHLNEPFSGFRDLDPEFVLVSNSVLRNIIERDQTLAGGFGRAAAPQE